jgi:phosphate/sulfate permease
MSEINDIKRMIMKMEKEIYKLYFNLYLSFCVFIMGIAAIALKIYKEMGIEIFPISTTEAIIYMMMGVMIAATLMIMYKLEKIDREMESMGGISDVQ